MTEEELKQKFSNLNGILQKLWLKPVFVNNNLHFEVDAEIGLLSLGLGILATMLYNGSTCQEMAQVDQNVFIEIGILNGLSATRNNGFASIFEIDL